MFGINPNFAQELIIWGSIFAVCLILEITTGAFYAHIFVFGAIPALILTLFRIDFDMQVISFLVLLFLMIIKVFFRYQKRTNNRPNPEAFQLMDSIQKINNYNEETNTYSLDAVGYRWEVITTADIDIDSEVIVTGIRANRLIVIKK